MKRKRKPTPEEKEEEPGEWWKEDYVPPPPPKKSLLDKFKSALHSINLKDRTPIWRTRKPTFLTFKCAVALLLFFIYLVTALFSMTSYPHILILLVPTMWILLDYIKKSRKESPRES